MRTGVKGDGMCAGGTATANSDPRDGVQNGQQQHHVKECVRGHGSGDVVGIKDHKRIKKDPSDPNIRVRGRNTLKQTVRLPSQTFMPIMPKRSLVRCAESAPPFGEKPICTPKQLRDYNGFYMSIGWSTIFFASILRPEKSPLSLWECSKGGCRRAKFSTCKWHKRFIGKEKHIPIQLNQCPAVLPQCQL